MAEKPALVRPVAGLVTDRLSKCYSALFPQTGLPLTAGAPVSIPGIIMPPEAPTPASRPITGLNTRVASALDREIASSPLDVLIQMPTKVNKRATKPTISKAAGSSHYLEHQNGNTSGSEAYSTDNGAPRPKRASLEAAKGPIATPAKKDRSAVLDNNIVKQAEEVHTTHTGSKPAATAAVLMDDVGTATQANQLDSFIVWIKAAIGSESAGSALQQQAVQLYKSWAAATNGASIASHGDKEALTAHHAARAPTEAAAFMSSMPAMPVHQSGLSHNSIRSNIFPQFKDPILHQHAAGPIGLSTRGTLHDSFSAFVGMNDFPPVCTPQFRALDEQSATNLHHSAAITEVPPVQQPNKLAVSASTHHPQSTSSSAVSHSVILSLGYASAESGEEARHIARPKKGKRTVGAASSLDVSPAKQALSNIAASKGYAYYTSGDESPSVCRNSPSRLLVGQSDRRIREYSIGSLDSPACRSPATCASGREDDMASLSLDPRTADSPASVPRLGASLLATLTGKSKASGYASDSTNDFLSDTQTESMYEKSPRGPPLSDKYLPSHGMRKINESLEHNRMGPILNDSSDSSGESYEDDDDFNGTLEAFRQRLGGTIVT